MITGDCVSHQSVHMMLIICVLHSFCVGCCTHDAECICTAVSCMTHTICSRAQRQMHGGKSATLNLTVMQQKAFVENTDFQSVKSKCFEVWALEAKKDENPVCWENWFFVHLQRDSNVGISTISTGWRQGCLLPCPTQPGCADTKVVQHGARKFRWKERHAFQWKNT